MTAALADVEEALKDVVDPELGINVVDLGLIYGIHVDEENVATVDMTLTSAACPLTDVIEDQAREALCKGPGGGLVTFRGGRTHDHSVGLGGVRRPTYFQRGTARAGRAPLGRAQVRADHGLN